MVNKKLDSSNDRLPYITHGEWMANQKLKLAKEIAMREKFIDLTDQVMERFTSNDGWVILKDVEP